MAITVSITLIRLPVLAICVSVAPNTCSWLSAFSSADRNQPYCCHDGTVATAVLLSGVLILN